MALLLDCDTGIDDALALAWLCLEGHVPVAVTTTAGNSTSRQSALNSLAVLDVVGRAGIAVAPGESGPLYVDLVTTPETHGDEGLGYAILPDVTDRLDQRPWLALWREALAQHPGQLSLLVTGPLTNLAVALREIPNLLDLLDDVVIMGGAFHHPGNTTPTAEWNAWVDPHAAAEVYAAFEGRQRLPLVCGLGLTEQVHINRTDLSRWGSELPPSPTKTLILDALRFYVEFHEQWGYGPIAHVPDLVAAMVAVGAVEVEETVAWVGVETSSELTRGTTCADVRNLWRRPSSARIASWPKDRALPDIAAILERSLGRVS